jgi:hypothetical protein
MFFVADAPRSAERKHAFIDAATDAAARIVGRTRALSRIVVGQTRTRCRDMREHFGGSRRGFWARGAEDPVAPPAGFEGPHAARQRTAHRRMPQAFCFEKFGIGGRQRILGGQAPMGLTGRLVGGLKCVEFGDEPIPQHRGLISG